MSQFAKYQEVNPQVCWTHAEGERRGHVLGGTVFVAGACVMIIELESSRILAPYTGTSIFVWTILIGSILASLSLGYWLGGRMADRAAHYQKFSEIIMLSGAAIIAAMFYKDIAFKVFFDIHDVWARTLCVALILFAPVNIFLGMVLPYAARLRMKSVEFSGRTVGSLSALSTVGSIVGTFLAGFYLIPHFSTTKTLFFVGGLLVLIGIAPFGLRKKTLPLFIVFFLMLYFILPVDSKSASVDLETESEYNHILVFQHIDPASLRPVRALATDPVAIQSETFLDDSAALVAQYEKYYSLAAHFNPSVTRSLMIGGGGYSYPKHYLKNFPSATMDVVEIDPRLTEIAKEYFGLQEDPRLSIYHEDGRTFLNTTRNSYDAIFMDAFHGCSPAYNLATKEAALKIYGSLNDRGVFIMNIVSPLNGEDGRFARAEYHTLKSVFPQVYIFPVSDNWLANFFNSNVMLVALKHPETPLFSSPDEETNEMLGHLWKEELESDVPLLTDEYAPVEYYLKNTCARANDNIYNSLSYF